MLCILRTQTKTPVSLRGLKWDQQQGKQKEENYQNPDSSKIHEYFGRVNGTYLKTLLTLIFENTMQNFSRMNKCIKVCPADDTHLTLKKAFVCIIS